MSTFKERNQQVTNTESLLILCEFFADDSGVLARIVNDVVDWRIGNVDYIGLPFEFVPPDDAQGQTSKGSLSIDSVGRGVSGVMESLTPLSRVYAKVTLTDTAEPEVAQVVYMLPMTSVNIGGVVAQAIIGVDYIMSQSAVYKRYDENTTPGIF